MAIVLDSNILIKLERAETFLTSLSKSDADEELFISVVTASELLHGVFRSKSRTIKQKRSAFVEAVFENFPILPIDLKVARSHALLWANMSTSGNMIGMNDSWIAASCLANGFKLATLNYKEFSRVPSLKLISEKLLGQLI